jgi:hypothetical protein
MHKAQVPFKVPRFIEDADETFFTEAFVFNSIIKKGNRVKVKSFLPIQKDKGFCCDVGFFSLVYQNHTRAPKFVCAKFSPRVPVPGWERELQNEIVNYLTLPLSSIRQPYCYLAAADKRTGSYCLLLEDLRPNTTIGNRVQALPVQKAQMALTSVAKLHAEYWGGTQAFYGPHRIELKAHIDLHSLKSFFRCTASHSCWIHRLSDLQRVMPQDVVQGTERWPSLISTRIHHISHLLFGPKSLRKRKPGDKNAFPMCLIHGDFNVENIFLLNNSREICFADFSSISVAHPYFDVLPFLIFSLKTETLLEHRTELLKLYRSSLLKFEAESSGFLVPSLEDLTEKMWMEFLIVPLLSLSVFGPQLLKDQQLGQGHAAKNPTLSAQRFYDIVTVQYTRAVAVLKHFNFEDFLTSLPSKTCSFPYCLPCV